MKRFGEKCSAVVLTASLLGGCSSSEEKEQQVLEHSTTKPDTSPEIHDGLETEEEAWGQLLADVYTHLHRTDLEGMNYLTDMKTTEVVRVGRIDIIDEATGEIKISLNDSPETCHTSTGTDVLTLGEVDYQGTGYTVASVSVPGKMDSSRDADQCTDGDLVLLPPQTHLPIDV